MRRLQTTVIDILVNTSGDVSTAISVRWGCNLPYCTTTMEYMSNAQLILSCISAATQLT